MTDPDDTARRLRDIGLLYDAARAVDDQKTMRELRDMRNRVLKQAKPEEE